MGIRQRDGEFLVRRSPATKARQRADRRLALVGATILRGGPALIANCHAIYAPACTVLNKTWAQPLTAALHAPSLSGAQYSEGAVSLPWPQVGNLAAVIGSARLIGGRPCSGMNPASFLPLKSMTSPISRLRPCYYR